MAPRVFVLPVALLLLAACPAVPADDTTASAGTSGTGGDATGSETEDATSTSSAGSTGDPTDPATSTTGPSIGCTPGNNCCNDDGQFEECFFDEDNALVWELVPGAGNPNVVGALSYCDSLSLLGSSGWRVPTMDELRTLVRGCEPTQSGGACEAGDDCATTDCRGEACDGCIDTPNEGPGVSGCYWEPNLQGTCGRYWTATADGDFGLIIDFDDASIRQADATLPAGLVRCVASGS